MGATTRGRIAGFLAATLLIGMVCGLPAIAAEPGTGMRLAEASPAAPAPASEEGPKAHIVSLGLWGLQNLFRTEAKQAAAVLQTYYGRGGQVLVKANTPTTTVVTAA